MSSLVINEKLIKSDDTGWTNISLQNGWTSMSGRTAQYRKIGNVVYLRGTITGGTYTGSTTLFNLPYNAGSDYYKFVVTYFDGSTMKSAYLYLRTNGNFAIDVALPGNLELTIGCNFVTNS